MKHVHAMHATPEIQKMQDIQLIHESIRFMRCIQSMCCTELMSCLRARRHHGLPVMHAIHGMHQQPCQAASLASLDNSCMIRKTPGMWTVLSSCHSICIMHKASKCKHDVWGSFQVPFPRLHPLFLKARSVKESV